MELPAYLKVMADKGASDLYLSTGARVMMKIEGKTSPVTQKPLPVGAASERNSKKTWSWIWPSVSAR